MVSPVRLAFLAAGQAKPQILTLGPEGVIGAVVTSISHNWNAPEPVWSGPDATLTFCSVELQQTATGWKLTQTACLTELLQRYGISSGASAPLLKLEDPVEEQGTPEDVRQAQGIVGPSYGP